MKVKELIYILSKEDEDLEVLMNVKNDGREFVYDISSLSLERIKVPYRKDFKAICMKPEKFSAGYVDREGKARV